MSGVLHLWKQATEKRIFCDVEINFVARRRLDGG
jgi:hypothetical protein